LPSYYAHPAVEDAQGVIAPWYRGLNGQLDERLQIAVNVFKRYPWVDKPKAVMAAPDFIYNSHWSIKPDGTILIPPTTDWMCGDLCARAWSIIKETLIKAGFPDFSFCWLGMGPLRWKIAAGASRSRADSGPNQVVGRLF
jgi:hypothetical protein